MASWKQFKVIPRLPHSLLPLREIAYNLWMAWNPQALRLFLTMDSELWERCHHNPVKMLGEMDQEKLNELAKDEGFLVELQKVHTMFRNYMAVTKGLNHSNQVHIAYFSAEFGLNDTLPIYSGGLGILAGDHVKSASDLNLKFVGVGILYKQGYFQQYLNQDGWQQDFYTLNDFPNMQIQEVVDEHGEPIKVEIEFPGRKIFLKIWKIEVGRVAVFLLDANDERNSPSDRQLTAQLYGGNQELRLQQEIILGIGGVRLLEKIGFSMNVLHMNEGHSGFAPFERMRVLIRDHRLTFSQANEIVRKSSVFTTHTNVQAGHDVFPPDLLAPYFSSYCQELDITFDHFISFGRIRPSDSRESFSMTVAAIRNSSYINGVSRLQAEVSRTMWQGIWPDVPAEHIPITSITNGVHIPTWLSFDLNDLYERYLGIKWREKEDYKDAWEKVMTIPDTELWSIKELRRRRLVAFTRNRLQRQLSARGATRQMLDNAQGALNPDVLTIGFARRFAVYKRAYLIFKDPQRLLGLLNHPEHPVQLIIAGKAHPQDQAGKEIIKNIIHFAAEYQVQKKIVFVEDYDFNVARYLLQGVDLWLNNPLRPFEACGTSGMKAACNGVLNLSVLDGWWDEAYDLGNGWAIGNREEYTDRDYQDEVESRAIYSILENEIAPLFYDKGSDGIPREWIKMIKQSLISIASKYNTHRMMKEYFYRFYKKAGEMYTQLKGDDFSPTIEFMIWKNKMREDFPSIRIDQIQLDDKTFHEISVPIPVVVDLTLGKVKAEDISVDVLIGRWEGKEEVENMHCQSLQQVEPLGDGRYRFSGHIVSKETGNFAFRVRVTPNHPLMVYPYEMNLMLWS